METKKATINGADYVGYPVGQGHMVYLRVEDLDSLSERQDRGEDYPHCYLLPCFDGEGRRLMGVWRNGAKKHIEPMRYDFLRKELETVRDCRNGQIRNTCEFNCKVIWS